MNTDSILLDFDQEVKNRCELIRVNAENVSANLQSALDLTLLAIPENVRKMTVKELMEKYHGDIQKAASLNSSAKSPPPSPKRKAQSPFASSNNNSKKMAKKETPTQQKNTVTKSKSPKQVLTKSPTHLTSSSQFSGHTSNLSNNTPRGTPRSKPSPKSPKMPKKP